RRRHRRRPWRGSPLQLRRRPRPLRKRRRMRVSELAKELGYKAAELVELAKAKGIKVEDARANIDARLAAAVRAQVPHRSKLTANPALMDVYTRVVTEEAARAAAKAAEPKPEKPPPKLNADGTEAPTTKRLTQKHEAAHGAHAR